jgi:hypothetical protein
MFAFQYNFIYNFVNGFNKEGNVKSHYSMEALG